MSERSLATLMGLVTCYSPSGLEGPAVEFLVNHMRALGYQRVFVDEIGNAVGMIGTGPRQIVLLGHIDTVPGEIPPRVEGDILYGRGAVDAKGPLAAFVDAAAAVGPVDGWQLVVIGAIDEERESVGARYVTEQYRPTMSLIGEPSRWDRITVGYKGSAWAQINVRRRMAHSAGEMQSASEAAVGIWNAIQAWTAEWNDGRTGAFDQLTPSLQGIASGEDGFEAWAALTVGVRLPLDFSPEEWYAALHRLVAGAEVVPSGYPTRAYRSEKNTPLVRGFLAGIRAAGGKPGFVLKTGTADLNIVGPAWGCPAVAYGPGDSALDHTPDEQLSLSEYARAVQVLIEVLRQVTRRP